jgi:hypothetical protein
VPDGSDGCCARPPIGAELKHESFFEIEIVSWIGMLETGKIAVRIEQQQETFGPEGQIGPVTPFDAAARDAAKAPRHRFDPSG